jgi:RNA polymerase sigma factor (sigma-70 family)
LLDDFVLNRIDFRARKLVRTLKLPDADLKDVRQDMTVEVLEAAEHFDPAKARWHTFVCRVLNLFAKRYSRDEEVRRRFEEEPPECVEEGIDDPFEEILDEIDPIAEAEMDMDVEHVLSQMSPRVREASQALKFLSPSKAAKALGIHRNSIYRLIASARRQFKKARFDS